MIKNFTVRAFGLLALGLALSLSSCDGFLTIDDGSSKNQNEGSGGDNGGNNGTPEIDDPDLYGEVSGWTLESYSGSKLNYTHVFTFHYDSKKRVCDYDEVQTAASGTSHKYRRYFRYINDLQIYNVAAGYEPSAIWDLNSDGRTVHYYTPSHTEDFQLTYTSGGYLESASGEGNFYQYYDEDDHVHENWTKILNIAWSGGNITKSSVTLKNPGGGANLVRYKKNWTFSAGKNFFEDKVIDPSLHQMFGEMWVGIMGKHPANMLKSWQYYDTDDSEVYMNGDGYSLEYKACADGIIRDITVTRKESGIVHNVYKYHILYFGIEDKPGLDDYIPEIN